MRHNMLQETADPEQGGDSPGPLPLHCHFGIRELSRRQLHVALWQSWGARQDIQCRGEVLSEETGLRRAGGQLSVTA